VSPRFYATADLCQAVYRTHGAPVWAAWLPRWHNGSRAEGATGYGRLCPFARITEDLEQWQKYVAAAQRKREESEHCCPDPSSVYTGTCILIQRRRLALPQSLTE